MMDIFNKVYIIKYIHHIDSLNINAIIIHPIWLIEEKEINFRNEVWFNPPIAPIKVDIIT